MQARHACSRPVKRRDMGADTCALSIDQPTCGTPASRRQQQRPGGGQASGVPRAFPPTCLQASGPLANGPGDAHPGPWSARDRCSWCEGAGRADPSGWEQKRDQPDSELARVLPVRERGHAPHGPRAREARRADRAVAPDRVPPTHRTEEGIRFVECLVAIDDARRRSRSVLGMGLGRDQNSVRGRLDCGVA
jgi:hypothetical protein